MGQYFQTARGGFEVNLKQIQSFCGLGAVERPSHFNLPLLFLISVNIFISLSPVMWQGAGSCSELGTAFPRHTVDRFPSLLP